MNENGNYVVFAKDWHVYKTDDLTEAIRVCKDLQDGGEAACIIDTKKGVLVEW